MTRLYVLALTLVALSAAGLASAQTASDQATPAAVSESEDAIKILIKKPAKQVFGAAKIPAGMAPEAIGSYAKGCLAGAEELPVAGPRWQAMRTSRNRNWAHPAMVVTIEKLAGDAYAKGGWNGLLVGDMSQPRGGPMLSGHASHQIGLDADIWLTPMPVGKFTDKDRENLSATPMVKDRKTINDKAWTERQAKLIRIAAGYPEVARIFVHPPIKAELCKWEKGDRSWLAKVRPYYGHDAHFHLRIKCPEGSPGCKNQAAPAPKDGTGCGEELAYWMSDIPWKPAKPPKPGEPTPKPAPPLTLASLPAECRAVVTAP